MKKINIVWIVIIIATVFVLLLYFLIPTIACKNSLLLATTYICNAPSQRGHRTWEMLYYLLAGIGALATFSGILATYQQTQRQIKKDVFLKSAELVIDELHARAIEIAYWWAYPIWINYAGKVAVYDSSPAYVSAEHMREKETIYLPGHQNKTTLLIHLSSALKEGGKPKGPPHGAETPESRKNAETAIPKHAERYREKFATLTKDADEAGVGSKTYFNSPMGELSEALETELSKKN